MSAYDQGPLAKYNSLTDRHLMSYFSNDRMRRHLIKNGLITKGGEVVSDAVYRVRIARREHRRRIRDLIAQAIIHKALEMERSRQIDIRKKIEEIAKIELVRRVRSDCNRVGDEECVSYFNEGNMDLKVRPKSAKAGPLKSRPDLEEARLPTTPDQESRKRLRRILPNEEIETKHLSQLDSLTLGEYARILEKQDLNRIDKLPYLGMGNEYLRYKTKPKPTKNGTKTKKKKTSKISEKTDDSVDAEAAQSSKSPRAKTQAQTTVSILFHAPSSNRNFEVMVVQQPSGGNTLILFKDTISNNTVFNLMSHRHKGFPFSLTFYIDNVKDSRISTCCEYKHKVGKRIGGPSGHFTLFSVDGDDPCFRCLAERDLENEKKESKPKDAKSNEQLSSRQESISVRSLSEERYRSDEDFESGSDSSSGEEEEDEEENVKLDDEEKRYSQSTHSSSSHNSHGNRVISVNVVEESGFERENTPEIEVNNGEVSEKEETNTNNNAVELNPHDNENINVNSGRTSIWTGRSEQTDPINPDPEKRDIKVEEEKNIDVKPTLILHNDKDLRKASISSSSSYDDESDTDNDKEKDIKNDHGLVVSANNIPDSDESDSETNVVVSAPKSNLFLNKMIDENSDSDSSNSSKSNTAIEVKPITMNSVDMNRNIGFDESSNPGTVENKVEIIKDKPVFGDDIQSTSSGGSNAVENTIVDLRKSSIEEPNLHSEVKTEKPVVDLRRSSVEKPNLHSEVRTEKLAVDLRKSSIEDPHLRSEVRIQNPIVELRRSSVEEPRLHSEVKTEKPGVDLRRSSIEEPSLHSEVKTEKPVVDLVMSTDITHEDPIIGVQSADEYNEPEALNINESRKRREQSESSSYEDSSSSRSTESRSSITGTVISAPVLTEVEREKLKINIPIDEDEPISPKFDDRQIEEPRDGHNSPRLPVIVSNELMVEPSKSLEESFEENHSSDLQAESSTMNSESTSDNETPIKVEHQPDEDVNVNIDGQAKMGNDSDDFDVCFVNDDISFKKAKEMFERINEQKVTSLTIKNCELPSYIFNFISTKLEAKKDLRKIELSGCEVEISLLKLLAKSLDKWPLLDTLILSHNIFVDYSLFDLVNVLTYVFNPSRVADHRSLRLFDISYCSLQENDFGQIIKMIADNTCVEAIVLDKNTIDRRLWQDLKAALEKNSHTKTVSIKNCVSDPKLLAEISNETPREILDRLIIS